MASHSRPQSQSHSRPSQRGAALVELTLLVPLFLLLLFAGLLLGDLILARLKLQEASRYLAWEMTSYPLSDHGSGRNERAFDAAAHAAVKEATERYQDLDSAEEGSSSGFGLDVELAGLTATVQNEPAPFDAPFAPVLRTDGGAWSLRALGRLARGARSLLSDFRFNLEGQVAAELSVKLRSRLLPWLHLGSELPLRSRFTLLADGWQLSDGADATIAGGRAGNHRGGKSPSGLWLQVDRMHFLGMRDLVGGDLPLLGPALDVLPFAMPSLSGAFVVSHRYGPGRACDGIPGYPSSSFPAQDARGGLANLEALVDSPRPACFDTAPFRDTQEYEASLYMRLFRARGSHFMGCQNAQADDPSAPRDTSRGDRGASKIDCEVAP